MCPETGLKSLHQAVVFGLQYSLSLCDLPSLETYQKYFSLCTMFKIVNKLPNGAYVSRVFNFANFANLELFTKFIQPNF